MAASLRSMVLTPVLALCLVSRLNAQRVIVDPPSHLAVAPASGSIHIGQPNSSGHAVNFTVTNTGSQTDLVSFSCEATGTVLCANEPLPGDLIPPGASVEITLHFSVGSGSSGRITLHAHSGLGLEDGSGYYDITVGNPGVATTPDGDTIRIDAGAPAQSAYFDVKNTGNVSGTWSLVCTAVSPASCVGVSPTSITLAAGATAKIRVDHTGTSVGTGRITLRASGPATDSGFYAVVVRDPGSQAAPSAVDLSPNNTFNWAKDKCLTFRIGQGWVQCGDYVLVHALPAFRTFDRDWAPSLIYNSGLEQVRPIIHANVTFPAAASLPDHFSVALFFNGETSPRREAFYTTSGMSETVDETRRMSVVMNANDVATGVYSYTLEARAWYATVSKARSAAGKMIVVNRRSSPYGRGWWLAGLERAYEQADGAVLVVLGDGSAKLYSRNADGTYTPPAGEYARLQRNTTEGGWDRILPGGGRVHFDASGRHVYTEDRDGNRTRFRYNAAAERVDTLIAEPTQARWVFHYGSDSVLDSIADPAGRTIKFLPGDGFRLFHPDGRYRRMVYASIGRVVRVDDERGFGDVIAYSSAGTVSRVQRPFISGIGVPTFEIRPAAAQGVDTANTAPSTAIAAVSPGAVADTLIDPRGNRTVFRTNLFGEPIYVRNAKGEETHITRNAASEPTRVRYANGRIVRLTWNAGRVVEFWDSTYAADHALSGAARMVFRYENANCFYDMTRVVRWTTATDTLVTVHSYDPPANQFRGCRLKSVTDERGHTTEYSYLADGRLRAVTEKNVPVWADRASGQWGGVRDITTTFDYHPTTATATGTRGNLYRITTLHPGLFRDGGRTCPTCGDSLVYRYNHYDAYGNLRLQIDPSGHEVQHEYDSMNRLRKATVEADSTSSILYEFEYDAAGNRTRVYTPYYTGAARSTYHEFVYNAWGLVEKEYDESRNAITYRYDLAGNLVQRVDRSGQTVAMTYDPLNRIEGTVIPASTQPFSYEIDVGGMPTRTIAVDTVRWHYNAGGQADTIRTRNGFVARTFFLDGTLRSETQRIGGRDYTLDFAYDLAGRRTRLQHPVMDSTFGTRQTSYGYVGADLRTITNPLGEVTQFEWDALGRLTRMAQHNGVVTRHFYNDAGNLDSTSIKSPTYLHYSSANSSWKAVDSLVYAARPIYDRDGQIVEELSSYDARTYWTRLWYDGAHRLLTTEQLFYRCQYADPLGIVDWQHCGRFFHRTGLYATYQWRDYDARGNQTQDDRFWIHLGRSNGYFRVESICDLWHDQVYNARSQHDHTKVVNSVGEYENVPCGWGIAGYLTGDVPLVQRYDREGNLRVRKNFVRTDNAPGNVAVDYDYFYYDAENRLAKSLVRADPYRRDICVFDIETDYQYDGLGRRTRKTVDITTWRADAACDPVKYKDIIHDYIYDGDHLLYERITEQWSSQHPNPLYKGKKNVIEVLYTRGPGGEAISRHVPGVVIGRITASGDTIYLKSLYFHNNRQQTAVAGSDFTGERYVLPSLEVREIYFGLGGSHDLWMQPPLHGGSAPTFGDLGAPPFSYGFRIWSLQWRGAIDLDHSVSYSGQPYDAETGLFYFRNRYYDGRTGRFTQEDPIGFAGGLNLYAYAYNNPVSYTDPFGLCPPVNNDFSDCGFKEQGLESAGIFDPILWLTGGLAGGIRTLGRTLASRGAKALIEPGKIRYLFGEASGSAHNIARSAQNALQMKRLGATADDLVAHLSKVVKDATNVARTFTNRFGTFEVRESLYAGPSGKFAKLESTWQVLEDGTRRLITVIPYGGY